MGLRLGVRSWVSGRCNDLGLEVTVGGRDLGRKLSLNSVSEFEVGSHNRGSRSEVGSLVRVEVESWFSSLGLVLGLGLGIEGHGRGQKFGHVGVGVGSRVGIGVRCWVGSWCRGSSVRVKFKG